MERLVVLYAFQSFLVASQNLSVEAVHLAEVLNILADKESRSDTDTSD